MKKQRRKIIKIDEELCDGCGNCIPGCPEQALQLVDTQKGKKARLVKEIFCDGLGACLGACPTGALEVVEREADPYDDEATIRHVKAVAPEMLEEHIDHMRAHAQATKPRPKECGCPSAQTMHWDRKRQTGKHGSLPSELRQWPIQLNLVSPNAPYFKNADITIIADCVPFSYANLHRDFIRDRAIAVGCPKFDDAEFYIEKIAQIIGNSHPKSVEVVHMEVPCCSGLVRIVEEAIRRSGEDVPLKTAKISIKGELMVGCKHP